MLLHNILSHKCQDIDFLSSVYDVSRDDSLRSLENISDILAMMWHEFLQAFQYQCYFYELFQDTKHAFYLHPGAILDFLPDLVTMI